MSGTLLSPLVGGRIATWHVDAAGRRELLPSITSRSRFDLSALALYLAQPALVGEFRPAAVWDGWSLEREIPDPVPGTRRQLRGVFEETVAGLVAGHEVVAVRVSGGMDSAAVLSAVNRVATSGTRVVSVVTDAIADSGGRVACQAERVVRTLLADADPDDFMVLPQEATSAVPWHQVGPRLDAAPGRNAAALRAAAVAGATLMLSGDGADELLTTPAFLSASLTRSDGPLSALRYILDHDPKDLPASVIAAAAGVLLRGRRRSAARVYGAIISTTATPGENALTRGYATAARAWATTYADELRDLLEQLFAASAEADTWARAETHLGIWPHDPLHLGSAIPVHSPFLEPPFVNHALGLPIHQRWDAAAPTPYLRRKAAVATLLDADIQRSLPRHKEGFAVNLRRTVKTSEQTQTLVDLGLIRSGVTVTDAAAALTLHALEDWARGALERGYEPARS